MNIDGVDETPKMDSTQENCETITSEEYENIDDVPDTDDPDLDELWEDKQNITNEPSDDVPDTDYE